MNKTYNFYLISLICLLGIGCNDKPHQESKTEPLAYTVNEVAIKNDSILQYITGRFDPHKDKRFDTIEKRFADREGMLLREEAYQAFKKMHQHALDSGIDLVIRSAMRNFEYQKGIWERKWTGETLVEGEDLSKTTPDPYERAKKILRFSSMPGTSRHHWGTEIDLNSFENDYFEKGEGLRIYTWLKDHAGEYGYCQVYTEKGPHRQFGYEEEKWHWSYLPIAKPLTDYAEKHLSVEDISGFPGAQTSDSLNVIGHYVLGIDPSCR